MDLVPIRLDSVWTCGTKPLAVVEDGPGRCPIDGTALVQVTAAVSWTCAGGAEESASPGTCADGSAKTKTYALRAHGNHNPQHGGLFFMASDNTHHLEGAYLSSGTFRMYFYDEFTKPQKLADVKNYKATLMVKDREDRQGHAVLAGAQRPLLQASIGKLPLPAEMYALVKFTPDGKDNRFDFTFPAYSKEPHAAAGPDRMTSAAPATTAPLRSTTVAARRPAPSSAGIDPALVPLPIPDTVPEMLAQLRTRTDQIRAFIDKGSFAAIYVPAFQAKDLALALDEHKNELTAGAAQGRRAGDRQTGALRLPARRVRRHRQQAADLRGVREVRRGRQGHPRRRFRNPQAAIRNEDAASASPPSPRSCSPASPSRCSRRGAQGDHVQVHLQRRRVPDPARSLRELPRDRRHRADVADDLRRRVPVGGVDPRGAGRGAHAAVERRGGLRRDQARAHAVAEGARRHPHVGDRRQSARRARSEAARPSS